MSRVNTPQLSDAERQALELGLKTGESHCFRTRCHVILLKPDGRNFKDVGLITGMSHISVNHWVSRFKGEGIRVYITNPDKEASPSILDDQDKKGLLEAVKSHRQRLQTAKAKWESSRGKSISESTLMSRNKNSPQR